MLTTNRRGTVSLCLAAAMALVVSACDSPGKDATTVVDLSNSSEVAALCGPVAHDVANSFSSLVLASLNANAAERDKALDTLKSVWKLENPTDKASVQKANDTLQQRAKTACTTPSPSASSSPSPTPSATLAACQTWKLKRSDYGPNSRWFANGIVEIKNAKTKTQARKAANTWLNQVKTDPALLADSAVFFLDKKVSQTGLFKDDCATNQAVTLFTELTLELALSDMTPDQAPANGINTGASADGVHRSSQRGITGDRTAIKVVRKNGKVVWIMWRCGNVVTIEIYDVPKGKTDNPPPKKLTPKNISEAPQNANPRFEEQQKPNPLPARPADKQPTKPADPPKTVPPPPAPPPPATTPRPEPPPPAEPPAPSPTDPGGPAPCAPGIRSC